MPNDPLPDGFGRCLTYAIYHSPLGLIEELLQLGADPRGDDGDGYPPLHAALSTARKVAGQVRRDDWHKIIALLLRHGADPNQRGLNDFTPLHRAVAQENPLAISLLLEAGADPGLATRIDDCETPGQMAERLGHKEMVALLKG